MEVVNRSASRSASRTSMSPRTQQMHPLTPSDFDYNDVALSRENNIPSILEIAKRDVSKMKEKVHSKKSPRFAFVYFKSSHRCYVQHYANHTPLSFYYFILCFPFMSTFNYTAVILTQLLYTFIPHIFF